MDMMVVSLTKEIGLNKAERIIRAHLAGPKDLG